jgi:hypothetical protein
MKVIQALGFARTATFQDTKDTRDLERVMITMAATEDDGVTPVDVKLHVQLDRMNAAGLAAQIAVHNLQELIGAGNVNMAYRGFDPAAEPMAIYIDLYTNKTRSGPLS